MRARVFLFLLKAAFWITIGAIVLAVAFVLVIIARLGMLAGPLLADALSRRGR